MKKDKKLKITSSVTEIAGDLLVKGEEVLTASDIDQELSLDSSKAISNKIITAKLNDLENRIDDSTASTDDVSIQYNEDGELTLNPLFLEYLQNATYKKPSIVAFSMSGLKSSYIVGETISSSSFSHYESETANIKGNLTLSITGGYSETIAPTASSQTLNLSTAYESTFVTHGQSVTFKLSGEDVKGNSISSSVSKTAYYPFYHGVSTSAEVTETLAKALTKKVGVTPGTYTYDLSEAGYVYWFTTTSITSIKDTNGNVIDYIKLDNLSMSVIENGTPVTYNVYRTSDMLVSGS